MNQKYNILLVEDDLDLGSLLKLFLENEGFKIIWDQNGNNAENIVSNESIELCIYDVMLPEANGFELAKKIKQKFSNIPFIFLTAKRQKEDRLYGLKLGADDYISKPFEPEELVLRIKNILKRSLQFTEKNISIGKYTIDQPNFTLQGPNFEKTLTEKEVALILYLYQRKNNLVRKSEILEELWGEDDYFLGRSLDVFISRIRKYFSKDSNIKINTVRGIGYIFKIENT